MRNDSLLTHNVKNWYTFNVWGNIICIFSALTDLKSWRANSLRSDKYSLIGFKSLASTSSSDDSEEEVPDELLAS